MTPLFPAQRAAEDFDKVLDGTASRAVADRHADLLATVELLRDRPEVQPRAEFVDSLRARLMAAAETELVPAPPAARPATVTPLRRRNRRRLGTVAASLVIVGGSAGMAAAASGALPGEALYPIKRGGEQVTTAVRIGDVSKGKALLGQAENRLDEIEALVASGSADPTLVSQGVDAFRESATAGSDKLFVAYQRTGDAEDITVVRDFAAEQMAALGRVAGSSDASTANLLVDAADTLADIDQQARVLCGSCGPAESVETPESLSDAAAAASVANLIARPSEQARTDVEAALAAAQEQRAAEASGPVGTQALNDLKAAAERSAESTPRITLDSLTTSDPRTGERSGPVRSTITKAGELVPVITGNTAVGGLLTGVTGTLDSTTSNLPVVGDTVDKTTDELSGTLGLEP
jgi:hypothetical protein